MKTVAILLSAIAVTYTTAAPSATALALEKRGDNSWDKGHVLQKRRRGGGNGGNSGPDSWQWWGTGYRGNGYSNDHSYPTPPERPNVPTSRNEEDPVQNQFDRLQKRRRGGGNGGNSGPDSWQYGDAPYYRGGSYPYPNYPPPPERPNVPTSRNEEDPVQNQFDRLNRDYSSRR